MSKPGGRMVDATEATKDFKVSTVNGAIDTETHDFALQGIVETIRTGGKRKNIRSQVEAIRQLWRSELEAHGDRARAKKAIDKRKVQLPGVLWSGSFRDRATPVNEKLVAHSGLLCADLDFLGDRLEEVREKLSSCPYVWLIFTSPSGDGLKVVFRVPADASIHLRSFGAIEKLIKDLVGVQVDESCKDIGRLCFLSFDPKIFHNPKAQQIEPLPEPEKRQPTNGQIDLSERQRIAQEILGLIDWQSESSGFVSCPGKHLHTTGDGDRDCKVDLDSVPTIHCFHNSCRGILAGINHEIRSRIGKVESASQKKTDEWPEPQTLPDKLPPVPAMDPKMIPEPFRAWLCDIADRMQCALDFPVIGAIVTTASLLGRRLAIRPKKHDDWTVVANLYGAIVGRPGILKTPALDESKKPLQRLEIEALKAHEEQKQAHEMKLMVLKAKKEELQKKIKEAIANGASTDGFEIPKEEELILRRYMVNDSTVEKLGELLNQNPNGLLLFRDELTGWLRTLDREGHENDRAFYLEAWNGNGSYTYDRIGRGTLNIEAACLSILGGIQPGPINDYLESTLKGGAGADGLFQRFQLLVYPDDPGPWENVDRWPNNDAKNAAFEILKKLAAVDFGTFGTAAGGASQDENDSAAIPYLRFSPEGQEIFDDWRAELENKIRVGDDHPAIEAHLSKYRSLMPSLALIFHVVSTIDQEQATPVSEDAAKMAAAWCDYLEAHARRIYHGLIQHDVSTAHRLARKITAKQLPNPFTARDVYRKHWTGLSDAETVESGAIILDELGWIKTEKVINGGRPTLEYQINPQLVSQES